MRVDIDFTAFVDATPSPHLVLDTDLVIRYVNPAYVQAIGRTTDELIGRYFFDARRKAPVRPMVRNGTCWRHCAGPGRPGSRTLWCCSGTTSPLPSSQVGSRSVGGPRSTPRFPGLTAR